VDLLHLVGSVAHLMLDVIKNMGCIYNKKRGENSDVMHIGYMLVSCQNV